VPIGILYHNIQQRSYRHDVLYVRCTYITNILIYLYDLFDIPNFRTCRMSFRKYNTILRCNILWLYPSSIAVNHIYYIYSADVSAQTILTTAIIIIVVIITIHIRGGPGNGLRGEQSGLAVVGVRTLLLLRLLL